MATDVDELVMLYVAVRDRIRTMKKAHEEALAQWIAREEQLSGALQEFLETNKLTNLKTKHGTCYISTRYTASLADPEAFMQHVISTRQWDLMDRRANATAVKAYVAQNNCLPAGVNLTGIQTLGVRRPTEKSDD